MEKLIKNEVVSGLRNEVVELGLPLDGLIQQLENLKDSLSSSLSIVRARVACVLDEVQAIQNELDQIGGLLVYNDQPGEEPLEVAKIPEDKREQLAATLGRIEANCEQIASPTQNTTPKNTPAQVRALMEYESACAIWR